MKEKFEKEKKEFEEEGDGSKRIMAIDEEKLEELINKIINMQFKTQEDLIEFFDSEYKKAIKEYVTNKSWNRVKYTRKRTNIEDPHWKSPDLDYGQDTTFEKGGDSMFLDQWIADRKNRLKT